jgi:hypothetical protein
MGRSNSRGGVICKQRNPVKALPTDEDLDDPADPDSIDNPGSRDTETIDPSTATVPKPSFS